MRWFLAATVVAIAGLAASGTANAAEQVPFTITEQVNFATEVNTFTATGPLCSSGTFVDTVVTVGGGQSGQPKANLLVTTVYTCDDGSGTFNMLKHVFIVGNPDGSFSNTGPAQILGGSGAYAGLIGHGVDTGGGSGDTAVGHINGWVLQS